MPKIVWVGVCSMPDGKIDSAVVWYDNKTRRIWGGDKRLPNTVVRFIASAKWHDREDNWDCYRNP